MKIIYPYNEILPLKKAHDAYIIRNCAALCDAGFDVTLLCGKGSLKRENLLQFYKIDLGNALKIEMLPILRKNNRLGLNWNYIFFNAVKNYLQKTGSDVVFFSVLKQADFFLRSNTSGVKTVYEVHQLQWYPTLRDKIQLKKVFWERSILNSCDLITVTTQALKDLLQTYPYNIQKPIEVVPLACDFKPLPISTKSQKIRLFYVGQLYTKQGVHHLLEALKEVRNIELTIVGGKPLQIEHYHSFCVENGLEDRVHFTGFVPPDSFEKVLKNADAFVTTFDDSERMPYVAHTKIYEYLAFQRPIVAPDMEIVKEHAPYGLMTYQKGSLTSLINSLKKMTDPIVYEKLKEEVKKNRVLNWAARGFFIKKLIENHLLVKTHS